MHRHSGSFGGALISEQAGRPVKEGDAAVKPGPGDMTTGAWIMTWADSYEEWSDHNVYKPPGSTGALQYRNI